MLDYLVNCMPMARQACRHKLLSKAAEVQTRKLSQLQRHIDCNRNLVA
ncbi:hypothetical protein SPHINGO8AM_40172 [Sphingomonas sp. 8AM]|nr:hypothetical protein SPHINGO8AM_40172 [Sphingomonas sp. 8AM]